MAAFCVHCLAARTSLLVNSDLENTRPYHIATTDFIVDLPSFDLHDDLRDDGASKKLAQREG
jgi:hypothetical protein